MWWQKLVIYKKITVLNIVFGCGGHVVSGGEASSGVIEALDTD